MRVSLRQFFGAFTIAAILMGFGAYIAIRIREENVNVFRRAYLEGRVTKATARQHVGDVVDSWPEMPPIRPTRQPWRQRK